MVAGLRLARVQSDPMGEDDVPVEELPPLHRPRALFTMSLVLFLLALLSDAPTAAPLPIALLILIWWRREPHIELYFDFL